MSTKGFYLNFLNEIVKGTVDPLSDTFRVYGIVVASYTVNLSTHSVLSSVPGGARIGFATLGSKTITSGVFDAADVTITNPSLLSCGALILVKWTGADATSQLGFYDDTIAASVSNPVNVAWDSGANKIWKLTG